MAPALDPDETRRSVPLAPWIVSVVAVIWVIGVLWLTIPREGVCWSILPAPAGCGVESRLPIAVVTSVLLLGLGVFTARASRRRPGSLRRWLLVTGFTVIATVGYYAVLYAQ